MSGEKTEEPTEQRLRDQRKKGQVPQRKNVIEAAYLIASYLLLVSLSSQLYEGMFLQIQTATDAVKQDFRNGLLHSFDAASKQIRTLMTFVAISFAFPLLVGLFLNKFNFAPQAMSPKFEKFNPVNGLKGMFSKSTLYNFFRLLIYFTAVSVILTSVLMSSFNDVLAASVCGAPCLAPFFLGKIQMVVLMILGVLLLLAAIDFRIQTKLFRNQNKMSKEDVKNEAKGQEGDPLIKSKRREIANEDATLPTAKDVTHVVYGPEFLVALIYYDGSGERPYAVSKARGGMVAKIQRRFREIGKPTVFLPGVAADFHRLATVGDYLPARSATGMSRIINALEQEQEV